MGSRRPAAATSAAIACPTSVVEALPPRSGVRGPVASTVSIARDDRVVRGASCALALAQEVQHQRAGPDHRDRVGDVAGRRCPAPSRAPARTATESGARGSGWRTAPGRSCRCVAGPRSDRMSPNRLLATTTSKRCGCSTKRAHRMSMCCLSTVHVGIVRPHRVGAAVPPRHADRDAVALGGHGQVLARARARQLEGVSAARDRRRGARRPTPGSRSRARCPRTSRRPARCTRPRCSRARRRSRCRRACGPASGHGTPSNSRTGRRLTYWSNSRRNFSSEPHSETWSGTVAGQPTAPK